MTLKLEELGLLPVADDGQFKAFDEDEPEGWLGDPNIPSLFLGPKLDEALIYCMVDAAPKEDLALLLESALPDIGRRQRKKTWLEWELDNITFEEVMSWPCGLEEREHLMLGLGICPGQLFVLRVEASYHTCHDSWSGHCETELEVDWELVWAEPLDPAEHARRWCEHLRSHLGGEYGEPAWLKLLPEVWSREELEAARTTGRAEQAFNREFLCEWVEPDAPRYEELPKKGGNR